MLGIKSMLEGEKRKGQPLTKVRKSIIIKSIEKAFRQDVLAKRGKTKDAEIKADTKLTESRRC